MVANLTAEGFTKPTPIQAEAIPLVMAGHDLIGLAQTGTGKTAAFGLPMIERMLADGKRADHADEGAEPGGLPVEIEPDPHGCGLPRSGAGAWRGPRSASLPA